MAPAPGGGGNSARLPGPRASPEIALSRVAAVAAHLRHVVRRRAAWPSPSSLPPREDHGHLELQPLLSFLQPRLQRGFVGSEGLKFLVSSAIFEAFSRTRASALASASDTTFLLQRIHLLVRRLELQVRQRLLGVEVVRLAPVRLELTGELVGCPLRCLQLVRQRCDRRRGAYYSSTRFQAPVTLSSSISTRSASIWCSGSRPSLRRSRRRRVRQHARDAAHGAASASRVASSSRRERGVPIIERVASRGLQHPAGRASHRAVPPSPRAKRRQPCPSPRSPPLFRFPTPPARDGVAPRRGGDGERPPRRSTPSAPLNAASAPPRGPPRRTPEKPPLRTKRDNTSSITAGYRGASVSAFLSPPRAKRTSFHKKKNPTP